MTDPMAALDQIKKVLAPHRPGRVTIFGHLCKYHKAHRDFSITAREADDVRACPDCKATVYASCTGCGPQVSAEECPVREAFTRLVAAVEKVLEGHDPIKLYASADGCGHPVPTATNGRETAADYAPWDEWNDSHPHGTNADGAMSDRICTLTEIGTACPACSRLVYDERGDDDGFVSASDCIVRPLIAEALAKGEGAP